MLAVTAALTLTIPSGAAPTGRASAAQPEALVARGRELYLTGCSSCHGVDGQGLDAPGGQLRGPSLERSGPAAAYYYLSTGRMPLANSEENPTRKDPAYDPDEIEALVAYVATLGEGPAIPEVGGDAGDLAQGGVLFRQSCAPCHSATGAGGALSYGRAAPTLAASEPLQVAAAIRAGPGQMPAFGRDAISDEELDAVADYVTYLRDPDDRGGVSLGRIGPIPEGFLVWIGGLGSLVAASVWIARRYREPAERAP
ncbi:MAG: c-type cytochrome [Acidimicrobiales bacterium]